MNKNTIRYSQYLTNWIYKLASYSFLNLETASKWTKPTSFKNQVWFKTPTRIPIVFVLVRKTYRFGLQTRDTRGTKTPLCTVFYRCNHPQVIKLLQLWRSYALSPQNPQSKQRREIKSPVFSHTSSSQNLMTFYAGNHILPGEIVCKMEWIIK